MFGFKHIKFWKKCSDLNRKEKKETWTYLMGRGPTNATRRGSVRRGAVLPLKAACRRTRQDGRGGRPGPIKSMGPFAECLLYFWGVHGPNNASQPTQMQETDCAT